jgi:hypothetical protein
MEQQQWNDLVELDSCDGDVMVGESLGREPPNGQQQQQIRPRPRITREPIIGRGRHLISTNGRMFFFVISVFFYIEGLINFK